VIAQEITFLNEQALTLQDQGLSRRDAIHQIVDTVLNRIRQIPGHLEKHPFPLEHDFADGIYMRTIYSPAGTMVVGLQHRFSHFCYIESGHVSVLTDDGPKELKGPCIFKSPAGSRRVVYHHTDVVWRTFHATNSTDPDEIEVEITYPEEEGVSSLG